MQRWNGLAEFCSKAVTLGSAAWHRERGCHSSTSMAVLLETSKGDMVVDLHTDDCPIASRNFLKLCK